MHPGLSKNFSKKLAVRKRREQKREILAACKFELSKIIVDFNSINHWKHVTNFRKIFHDLFEQKPTLSIQEVATKVAANFKVENLKIKSKKN